MLVTYRRIYLSLAVTCVCGAGLTCLAALLIMNSETCGDSMPDDAVRLAAFNWLREQVSRFGDTLSRPLLVKGFEFQGNRVPLMSPQGIFKPRVCELPLSITTTVGGPYQDSFDKNGHLLYSYRGTDPQHRDNQGLRTLMLQRKPLVYFHAIVKGKYLPVWPVYIVGDDPSRLRFTALVDADDAGLYQEKTENYEGQAGEDARREYLTRQVQVRMHQHSFRERVLRAYQEQCAFCRLKHAELLDAAHIVPDKEPLGEPKVVNGVALCKLHHAAFDRLFIGIRPDYTLEVRRDILEEPDGPVLEHGLKAMHDQRIILPRHRNDWPNPDLLEIQYERFRAGASHS